jgi:hypothetical protein
MMHEEKGDMGHTEKAINAPLAKKLIDETLGKNFADCVCTYKSGSKIATKKSLGRISPNTRNPPKMCEHVG